MEVPYTEECLGAVTTPGATFTVSSYVLNPANASTFPWLSTIATKFEKYQFHTLSFRFVSTSADAVGSTTTSLGSVLLNTDYDVLDANFASQTAMEDYGGCAEGKPASDLVHKIDCVGKQGGSKPTSFDRYTLYSADNTPPYPGNSSAHDYDVGLFQLATVGQQAACTIGRLYVCYSLRLIRKKVDTSTLDVESLHLSGNGSATAESPLAGFTSQTGSNLAGSFGNGSVTITDLGRYMLEMNHQSSQTLSAVPSATAGSNVTFISGSFQDTIQTGGTFAVYNATSNNSALIVIFDVTATGGVVNLLGPTGMTSLGRGDLRVSQLASGQTMAALRRREDALLQAKLLNMARKYADREETKEDYEYLMSVREQNVTKTPSTSSSSSSSTLSLSSSSTPIATPRRGFFG
jgi:hypothetical protein